MKKLSHTIPRKEVILCLPPDGKIVKVMAPDESQMKRVIIDATTQIIVPVHMDESEVRRSYIMKRQDSMKKACVNYRRVAKN